MRTRAANIAPVPPAAPPSVSAEPAAPIPFSVPARHNPRLQTLVERLNADEELRQWWRCANVNAVDRLGGSDHGETHVRIVANAALKLLRLLAEAGHSPSAVVQHRLTREDAEVVVVLAAALHDVGLAVHDHAPAAFSLALAHLKATELLRGLYPVRERTLLVAETLHALAAHAADLEALTLEADLLKIADALDMTRHRLRAAVESGRSSLNPLALPTVEEVLIQRGDDCPVRVEIHMSSVEGLVEMSQRLYRKLQRTRLHDLIAVVVQIEGEPEARRLPVRVVIEP